MTRTGNPAIQVIRAAAARIVVAAVLFGAQALASPAAAAGGPPHPMSSDRMLAHMTTQLNLTDAQAQQIKQVLDSHQVQMTAQGETLKTAREALHQAASASPVNEAAIRSAAQAVGQAEGDAALLHARVHALILPLLNSDQRQKFSAFGEGRREGRNSHTSEPAD
jgi:Spy/CpxP family protein refolding chaperone